MAAGTRTSAKCTTIKASPSMEADTSDSNASNEYLVKDLVELGCNVPTAQLATFLAATAIVQTPYNERDFLVIGGDSPPNFRTTGSSFFEDERVADNVNEKLLLEHRDAVYALHETQIDRLQRYVKELDISDSRLHGLVEAFYDELKRGLSAFKDHPGLWEREVCSFKMLDSCVPKLPSGKEEGIVYALDFGGTNFRVVRAVLNKGQVATTQRKYSLMTACDLPKAMLDRNATATMLFDFFAGALKDMMIASGDLAKNQNISAKQFGNNNNSSSSFSDGSSGVSTSDATASNAPQPAMLLPQPRRPSFDATGTCSFVQEPTKKPDIYPIGFTFSFPCYQTTINGAKLAEWTKDFETGRNTNDPVEGKNVGSLLEAALKRQQVPASVTAIVNDTVGCLVSGCCEKTASIAEEPSDGEKQASSETLDDSNSDPKIQNVMIGLIVGTGVNACYYEENACDFGYQGNIINLESGNFDRMLPLTHVDYELDFQDRTNRAKQLLEKMISGAYLGEIARRFIVRMLQHKAPAAMWIPGTLKSADVTLIAEDNSPTNELGKRAVQAAWKVPVLDDATVTKGVMISETSFKSIKIVCHSLVKRAARLAAVMIIGIALRIIENHHRKNSNHHHVISDFPGLVVCIDGSLYKCSWIFRELLGEALISYFGKDGARKIKLRVSDDGSGRGAALIAAVVHRL